MKLRQKLVEFLSLDYRSLALMRFGIGLIIILDLFERARSMLAHYTDAGLLSRADLLTLYGNKYLISLHMMSGLALVQAALFAAAGIFAVMLMLGYRTRLATVASWFLLISLQSRNPMVLQGADVALRVVLFWAMFLPLGARWSLDRLFGRTARKITQTIASPATLAYIVQIVIVYFFSGFLKTGTAWHNGTAVYYALSVDQLVRPLGEHLRTWTALTHFLTYATQKFELYGSLLYFSPWKTGLFRTLAIVLYALMQIGFNISMHLGLFGLIAIVITLGLLPPYFWDAVWYPFRDKLRSYGTKGLKIYYDSNCGFCYKSVHVLKNFLLLEQDTALLASDTDGTIGEIMARENSWVVVDSSGTVRTGFLGLATVFAHSPAFLWLAPIMRLPGIRSLGQWCYRKVADNRLMVCLPDPVETPKKKSKRIAIGAVLVFLTLLVIAWNANYAPLTVKLTKLNPIAWITRLDQSFDMFAPAPLTEDGWYVMPGILANGQSVDIFKNGPMLTKKGLFPVSYQKPRRVADGYPDQRWQKYLMNIAEGTNESYRLPYGKYLCRTWNATHEGPETLVSFDIYFMIEDTPQEGMPDPAPRQVTLWEHKCF